MRLQDFVVHPIAKEAKLSEAMVAALRFYTTAAYKSINAPLRDQGSAKPHPLPITVGLICKALKKLRKFDAHSTSSFLYRGLKNTTPVQDLLDGGGGGTELAVMSTTSSLKVAMQYAASQKPLLLRISSDNYLNRGPEISFLSAFPDECEFVYPPLTYLQPTGSPCEKLCVYDKDFYPIEFTVINVKPTMA